ncbi:hypothetical protein D6833_07715, partial [Candidatus Parcubacteria bacterium]
AMAALSDEQRAALRAAAGNDDDADGLTNTQEAWWCTDPASPDSDNDGVSDGDEVSAAKAWLNHWTDSYPASGKPFSGWPPDHPGCYDDDYDGVPDQAETWDLGLNPNRESTDRDKFDDGQELFGTTNCPGSGGFCGYGVLPRNEDWGTITAQMPAWVKAPGNHPLVAAFPVPEVDVVESSFHVQTVTEVTTDHTIITGTEKTYSTAKTEGTSDSDAETTTWNNWQETSTAIQTPMGRSVIFTSQSPRFLSGFWGKAGRFVANAVQKASRVMDYGASALMSGSACFVSKSKVFTGALGDAMCKTAIRTWDSVLNTNYYDIFDIDGKQADLYTNRYVAKNNRLAPANGVPYFNQQYLNNRGGAGDLQGTHYVNQTNGQLLERQLYEIKTLLRAPMQTTTNTKGYSWGGSRTTTHTTYQEHTVTNGEAFSNQQSWGTATAVDSAQAADLWFTYVISNTGDEYAREIADLAFNIYLGDD